MPKKGFSKYVMGYAHPDTTERFFPTSGPLPAPGAKYFRTGLDVYQFVGGGTIYPAVQVSNDPEEWPGSTTFTRVGTHSATQDGISYSSGSDVDMSSTLQARYYREGFTMVGGGGNTALRPAMVATSFFKRPA